MGDMFFLFLFGFLCEVFFKISVLVATLVDVYSDTHRDNGKTVSLLMRELSPLLWVSLFIHFFSVAMFELLISLFIGRIIPLMKNSSYWVAVLAPLVVFGLMHGLAWLLSKTNMRKTFVEQTLCVEIFGGTNAFSKPFSWSFYDWCNDLSVGVVPTWMGYASCALMTLSTTFSVISFTMIMRNA